MSLLSLFLPQPILLALAYKKMRSQTDLSESHFLRLENKYGGRNLLLRKAKESNLFTKTSTIGKKDIGCVLFEAGLYPLALVYLDACIEDFPVVSPDNKDKAVMFALCMAQLCKAEVLIETEKYQEAMTYFYASFLLLQDATMQNPADIQIAKCYNFVIRESYNYPTKYARKHSNSRSVINTCLRNLFVSYQKEDSSCDDIVYYLNQLDNE